jgi:hypothetical protein
LSALAAVLLLALAPSASVPTATFAPDGTLWVVWVDGQQVSVASSKDLGRTFSPSEPVNREPEKIDANGEARPKIAVGPKGEVYVTYTQRAEAHHTGNVRFSRRGSDGRFSPPVTLNDAGPSTGHRFDVLSVSPQGRVHVFWFDDRDRERAALEKQAYEGWALYGVTSADGGRTFSPNRKLKDHVCDCCRLSMALDGETPVLFWRDLLADGIRDHVLARVDTAQPIALTRATDDDWKIAGCPHHGPAIAVGPRGAIHLAWFTGDGKRGAGTFYRRSLDGGRTFSEPVRMGGAGAGRPQVAALGHTVWVAWKESASDGRGVVRAMRSGDDGATWDTPREVARTAGDSDHPLLLVRGPDAFLSWFSKTEGYRVQPLEPLQASSLLFTVRESSEGE